MDIAARISSFLLPVFLPVLIVALVWTGAPSLVCAMASSNENAARSTKKHVEQHTKKHVKKHAKKTGGGQKNKASRKRTKVDDKVDEVEAALANFRKEKATAEHSVDAALDAFRLKVDHGKPEKLSREKPTKERSKGKQDTKKDIKPDTKPDSRSAGELAKAKKSLPRLRNLVTSLYGERRMLASGVHFHAGLDIRAHIGWPVVSFRDGVVEKAGMNGSAGIMVEIAHDNGFKSMYAHLRRATVAVGQRVVKGEKIGEVGCTGRTTGAHLHVAIHTAKGSVDPLRYLTHAEDVLRPRDAQIPEQIGPQECSGRMRGFTPAAGAIRGRKFGLRGRRRINLESLRTFRPPDIPVWQSRRRAR